MSINKHLISLSEKHEQLKEQIREAYLHHQSTSELKKAKLKLKDEMSSLLSYEKQDRRKAA